MTKKNTQQDNTEKQQEKNLVRKVAIISAIIATILLISGLAILFGILTVNEFDDADGGVPPTIPELELSIALFIGTLISLGVILLLTYLFFWDPMQEHLEKRKNNVAANIDAARTKNKKAEELINSAEKNIEKSKIKSSQIISETKHEASMLKKDILDNAKSQSDNLMEETRQKIEKEKSAMGDDIKNEIIETSLLIAEKILEKEIDDKKNKKMVNDLIKEINK